MKSEVELFEAYYRQELTPEEAAAFEQTLKLQKDVASRYRDFTYMAAGIQYYNRLQLLNKLKQDRNIINESPLVSVVPFYRRKWILAAAAALVLAVSSVIYFMISNASKTPLYLSYDQPFTEIEISRPRGESILYELKIAAAKAYENGDYAKSLQLLKRMESQERADGEIYFMQGLNQLALDSLIAAERSFKEALSFRFENVEDATWFMIISYLKQGKRQEAISLLKDLANTQGKYQQQSKELLAKIE